MHIYFYTKNETLSHGWEEQAYQKQYEQNIKLGKDILLLISVK